MSERKGVIGNIAERLTRRFRRSQQIDVSTHLRPVPDYRGNTFSLYSNSEFVTRIFSFLENCTGRTEQLTAKQSAELSRLIYDAFPFAKRAVRDMASMVGNGIIQEIKPGSVLDTDLQDLQELAKGLPLLTEFQFKEARSHGMDKLIFNTGLTVLIDGMAFAQDRYQGNINNYLGALQFDSPSFSFHAAQNLQDGYKLYYRNKDAIDRGVFFDWCGYDFRNYDIWAYPLLDGGRFFTEILLKAFVAIANINLRKGSPIDFTLISIDGDGQMSAKSEEIFATTASGLKSAFKQGVANQKKGIAANYIATLPSRAQMHSQAFGSALTEELSPDLLDRLLAQFANLLDIPVEQLGVVLGSAGFSPERFRMLYRIWSGKIDNLREIICPYVWGRMLNYYRAQGVDPSLLEKVKLGFKNVEINDAEAMALINKQQAEADEKRAKVAQVLNEIVSADAAREYLLKNDLIE